MLLAVGKYVYVLQRIVFLVKALNQHRSCMW
jgi:hypothetical protein